MYDITLTDSKTSMLQSVNSVVNDEYYNECTFDEESYWDQLESMYDPECDTAIYFFIEHLIQTKLWYEDLEPHIDSFNIYEVLDRHGIVFPVLSEENFV